MVRIPKNGPPTHPGGMLLEEFLKPLEIMAGAGMAYWHLMPCVRGKR